MGYAALEVNTTGHSNVAVGYRALDSNTTANENTAVGFRALEVNTTGTGLVAVGKSALALNTTGEGNVAIGTGAAGANTTASHNIAIGAAALDANTTGAQNVAIGYDALGANISGPYQTAVGVYSLSSTTTGEGNTGFGYDCGKAITDGENNTVVGRAAGDSITTANTNTMIGHYAGHNTTVGGSNVCVGNYARTGGVDTVNSIILGDNLYGESNDFAFGKASNVVTCDFDADADFARSSDIRLKDNIESTEVGLDFINLLRPVKFTFKDSSTIPEIMTSQYSETNNMNTTYVSHGFIAQEVKVALDSKGDSSFGVWHLDKRDNETQKLKKNMLIMPLVKAVQELSAKVDTLTLHSSVLEQEAGYHLDNIILDGTNGSSANAGDDVLLG
jgi:hypothetical protein